MSSSKDLRTNTKQHKVKNTESQKDDVRLYVAMRDCLDYLRKRFADELSEYTLSHEQSINFLDMVKFIKDKNVRKEFDTTFAGGNRTIKPDGGVIWLTSKNDADYKKLVLTSEMKKQGTNDARAKEGKQKQAQGNAIERLGKNLTGIKAMMNHEDITPFVCFGWGCDFAENYNKDDFVMSKISMLNEFYRINKIHVHKRDGDRNVNKFAPVSMFFREKVWDRKSMLKILKEVGEDAIRYYLH